MAQFNDAHYNEPAGGELQRRNRVALRRLHTIARLRGKRPAECRLLDVGCSRGHFVRAALEYGFDAEGVEPARRIAAAARDAGLRIHTGLLEEQDFDDDSYDALTLFEVIEHLSEPRVLLAECRRVLKPGGILVVSTGNAASWTAAIMKARWDYFQMERDGGHISFFNRVSLARLASVCGFTVARIGTARVKFHEKGQVAPGWYSAAKIAAETLNVPARLLGRGHDMVAFLRRV
jgi:2-polyprenyl-3-methyl-5-hydroxy-6-metoxy-1,4-benzoquinol methylase